VNVNISPDSDNEFVRQIYSGELNGKGWNCRDKPALPIAPE
jgi:hypothetical protein